MQKPSVFAVILAGGQSARLYPFNKVLSDLTNDGRTLIQQAYDRLTLQSKKIKQKPIVAPENLFVLTTDSMALPIRAQLRLPSSHLFVDPVRRGTWPALLWAMGHLRLQNPEAVMGIVTADHVIPDTRAFRDGVAKAVACAAAKPAMILLGVKPTTDPADWLGFGCFKMGKSSGTPAERVHSIVDFEEKPSHERATELIVQDKWMWNAGMFFFRISLAERAMRRHQPAMAELYDAMANELRKGNVVKAKALYQKFPAQIPHPLNPERIVDNTIDYAMLPYLVRDPGEDGALYGITNALPQWADVGEWTSLRRLCENDRHGNVKLGRVRVDAKTERCIIAADRGLSVEIKGLKDAIVTFANNTAFLFPVSESKRVKTHVAEIQNRPREKVLLLGESRCLVRAKGARLAVYGLPPLEIHLAKNRLRVVAAPSVL